MTNNDKTFIGWAINECIKEGVSVHLVPKQSIKFDNEDCAGCFSDGDRELYVATKTSFKNFFPTFLHEFCHFKQWQTKEPSYMKVCNNPEVDADMWEWIEGKDIPMKRVRKSIHSYRLMELNCEKMALNYIKNFDLSINKEHYIVAANVYVLFYGVIEETRKWFKYSPYDDRLFDLVPKNFVRSFRLPKGFKKRALSVCY